MICAERVPDLLRHLYSLALFCLCFGFTCPIAGGQSDLVQARVSSAKGLSTISGNGMGPHPIGRGDILLPGQEIDTRSGGELVIELSDGSLVIVRPGSRVLLKDFRTIRSVRELFEVLLGRVRVKINHLGGRPNPYRMNSPTASIAVRGTEFSVAVAASGTTRVFVYEGVVEVSSLAVPGKTVLVHPGQGVIVRPGQEIRFLAQTPWGEVGGLGGSGERENDSQQNSVGSANNQETDPNGTSPRNSAGIYNQSVEDLIAARQNPLAQRFAAYPDSYLDTLENPAYATEFLSPEGRIYLLPAFSGVQQLEPNETIFPSPSTPPLDYSLAPQASFFTPLRGGRTALGGTVAGFRSGVQSLSVEDNAILSGSLFAPGTLGTRAASTANESSFVSGSFAIAHSLGNAATTSVGFGVDYVHGGSSLRNLVTQQDSSGLTGREDVRSRASLFQTRLSWGITHTFGTETKLGLSYSYGFLGADFRDRSHLLNGSPQAADFSLSSGRVSEAALRLRGMLTSRLFYGIELSGFQMNLDRQLHLSVISDSRATDQSAGGDLTFGLGYALRPRIVLTFDLSGGLSSISSRRMEDATQNLLEARHTSAPFVAAHEALQADVWRHFFVDASLLTIWQKKSTNLTLYPDRLGRLLTTDGVFAPNGMNAYRSTNYYSEFGAGWRFTDSFLAEYVFSTTYGFAPSSHLVLFRYTFHKREP